VERAGRGKDLGILPRGGPGFPGPGRGAAPWPPAGAGPDAPRQAGAGGDSTRPGRCA